MKILRSSRQPSFGLAIQEVRLVSKYLGTQGPLGSLHLDHTGNADRVIPLKSLPISIDELFW